MSEPMVSHDCIAFYLLSREVAKHCKVVQSGQGADELFAGYHWYPLVDGAEDPVAAYLAAFRDRSYEEYAQTMQQQWCRAISPVISCAATSPSRVPRPRWTRRCASTAP